MQAAHVNKELRNIRLQAMKVLAAIGSTFEPATVNLLRGHREPLGYE